MAASVQPPAPAQPASEEELAECVRTLRALIDVVGTVQRTLDRIGRQAPVREAGVPKRARAGKLRKSSRKGKRKAKA
ncbi:hypothetical protein AW736_11590 [Termitidicoccus mucosus]|uniref:Uncharacterized protein n=1 Tax=Termitidicoccus mucosus TaxID=1184151 RepID=A0A178IJ65_9BACT|nr:hypothetical protein AW736_11590 [Opitutaceae bacterium TSB47]